jgi:hypothetical protein
MISDEELNSYSNEDLELLSNKCRKIHSDRIDKCDHTFVEIKSYGGSECSKCGKDGEWYCPDSPNHQCVYTKSYDWCDFCGGPEERK